MQWSLAEWKMLRELISDLFLRKYKLKLPVVASYFVTGAIRQLGLTVGSLESNPKLIPQYQVQLQKQRLSTSYVSVARCVGNSKQKF